MATIKISALPSAISIDATADFLPIVQSGVTNKINRNTFLGITGAPIGTTDSQTISNKTIGITNTVTVLDSLFTIQDNVDNTKQVQFQLSGNTTGTTRTYAMPNASVTLASLTGTETLTNKTLTSPIITGGTIDNSTITVDSISGHSTSTIVTVANMQISNGVINSANAVTATSIAAGAVQPQALVTGTGTGWSWQSYTSTPTNLTIGNGTLNSKYIQIGKTVFGRISFVFGSTSSISGSVIFTLPVTSVSYPGTATTQPIGDIEYFDGASALTRGWVAWASTTTCQLLVNTAGGTYVAFAGLSSSVPYTWATNMQISLNFSYEAA